MTGLTLEQRIKRSFKQLEKEKKIIEIAELVRDKLITDEEAREQLLKLVTDEEAERLTKIIEESKNEVAKD